MGLRQGHSGRRPKQLIPTTSPGETIAAALAFFQNRDLAALGMAPSALSISTAPRPAMALSPRPRSPAGATLTWQAHSTGRSTSPWVSIPMLTPPLSAKPAGARPATSQAAST